MKDIFTDFMPVYQRRSMLITLFSTFEVALKNLFVTHANTTGKPFKTKKRKGENVSVLEHWFNQAKAVGMDLRSTDTSIDILSDIHCLRLVRNALVHDDGMHPNAELRGYIVSNPHLSIDGCQIIMGSTYVSYAVSRLKMFAEILIRECMISLSPKATS